MMDPQSDPGSRAVGPAARWASAWSPDTGARPFFLRPMFMLVVMLPTLVAIFYYGLFASDIYISESRFVVRSPSRSATSPLGVILSAGGLSSGSEESNALVEYVRSRDALDKADADGLIRESYNADKASWFDRFGGLFRGTSREHLYEYYLKKVGIENDPLLQVTRLQVQAFTPQDARAINERLLRQAEQLVNQLSERARGDAISIAEREVQQAQERARTTSIALGRFRDRRGIIDPEREAEVRLQMVSKLQDELIATRTQLEQLQAFTPQASQIPYLRSRIRTIEREIAEQSGSIAGGSGSLSDSAVRYQELRLDSELAAKQLAAAYASLEEARTEARRKRAYLERISKPSLPDYASEPRRVRGILATLILGLLAWGVLSTLIAGVREHRD